MAIKLRLERVARDLSQTALATLTHNRIPQPRISELERGCAPRREEAEILGQTFGMNPVELFKREN